MMFEIFGWAGTIGVLFAYLQAARGVWPATGLMSTAVNMAAGLGLAANSLHHAVWPAVALNGAWVTIGLAAMVRRAGSHATPVAATPVPSTA